MESSLKQRIYENILGIIENWRYIKSTAEATIPNFILLYISFMIVAFFDCTGGSLLPLYPPICMEYTKIRKL